MCPEPANTEPAQAAAEKLTGLFDRELIDQLEQLAALLGQENPDLGEIITRAAARLRELTQ